MNHLNVARKSSFSCFWNLGADGFFLGEVGQDKIEDTPPKKTHPLEFTSPNQRIIRPLNSSRGETREGETYWNNECRSVGNRFFVCGDLV